MIKGALVSKEIHELHVFGGCTLRLPWHDMNASLTLLWLIYVIIVIYDFVFLLLIIDCFAFEYGYFR